MRMHSRAAWHCILVLALVLCLAAACFAWNDGPGPRPGQGPGQGPGQAQAQPQLSAEKQAALDRLLTEQMQAARPLLDELFVKEHELAALEHQDKADLAAVRAAAKEVTLLRGRLMDQAQAFRARVEKETGQRLPLPGPPPFLCPGPRV